MTMVIVSVVSVHVKLGGQVKPVAALSQILCVCPRMTVRYALVMGPVNVAGVSANSWRVEMESILAGRSLKSFNFTIIQEGYKIIYIHETRTIQSPNL